MLLGHLSHHLSADYTIWDAEVSDYVYPFIFMGTSNWSVDICAEVPNGYEILGVYDADGDFSESIGCVQLALNNETKVVAFHVSDQQSPGPYLKAKLNVEHKGKVKKLDFEINGYRKSKDKVKRGSAMFSGVPIQSSINSNESNELNSSEDDESIEDPLKGAGVRYIPLRPQKPATTPVYSFVSRARTGILRVLHSSIAALYETLIAKRRWLIFIEVQVPPEDSAGRKYLHTRD